MEFVPEYNPLTGKRWVEVDLKEVRIRILLLGDTGFDEIILLLLVLYSVDSLMSGVLKGILVILLVLYALDVLFV